MRRKTSKRTLRTQSDDYWEGWLHCTLKVNALTAVDVQYALMQDVHTFSGHYLRNRSNLDIGVLGYIGIV